MSRAVIHCMCPVRDTGLTRTLGGSVHVVAAAGHRFSFDGTQIVGPDWLQITFLVLL